MIAYVNGKPYQRIRAEDICYDGAIELVGAIVQRAVRDYIYAIKRNLPSKRLSLERFFVSAYFHSLSNLNGEHVMKLASQIAEEEIQEEHAKHIRIDNTKHPRKRPRKSKYYREDEPDRMYQGGKNDQTGIQGRI